MSDPRQISDLPELSVEDTVSLIITPIGRSDVAEFQLTTDPSITWWKSIQVRMVGGVFLGSVETENSNHGPHWITVPAAVLPVAKLTLLKAKVFGVHTGMYEIDNLSSFAGKRLEFVWQRDVDSAGPIAGFFRDLGNGIGQAASAVANAVESVFSWVAQAVYTVVEWVGNALASIFNGIGALLGLIPFIGGFLQGVFHWVATAVSAAFEFTAMSAKAVLDRVGGVFGGVVRVVGGGIGGLLAWDSTLFIKGLGDIVANIVGPFIARAGTWLARLQAILFMQSGERSLTEAEIGMLRRVYRDSLDLSQIRVIDGFAGFFSTNDNPFTLGNRIYMKNTVSAEYAQTLVHECCHVWQSQHYGSRYIIDSFFAVARYGVDSAYSWQDELKRGRFRWQDFTVEAQARFLEDVFVYGELVPRMRVPGEFYNDNPIGKDVEFKYNGKDFTEIARKSVTYVRTH